MSDSAIMSHIVSRPGVCGGKPCVAGTRIRVQDIYVWHELRGQTPDEIVADYPQLSLADVHAALTYYYDHRPELDRQMKEEIEWAEVMRARHPSILQAKFSQDADTDSISP